MCAYFLRTGLSKSRYKIKLFQTNNKKWQQIKEACKLRNERELAVEFLREGRAANLPAFPFLHDYSWMARCSPNGVGGGGGGGD